MANYDLYEFSSRTMIPGYSGWIGLRGSGRLSGWIRQNNNVSMRLILQIKIGTYVSSPVVANEFRPHVLALGIGDGQCGFYVELDRVPSIDGSKPLELVDAATGVSILVAHWSADQIECLSRLKVVSFQLGDVEPDAPMQLGEYGSIEVLEATPSIVADESAELIIRSSNGVMAEDVSAHAVLLEPLVALAPERSRWLIEATQATLKSATDVVDAVAESAARPKEGPARKLHGWVGVSDGRLVSGWLLDLNDIGSTLWVRVAVGEFISRPIEACDFRQHLIDRELGDGCYGFGVYVPRGAVIQGDTVRVLLEDYSDSGLTCEVGNLAADQTPTKGLTYDTTKPLFSRKKQEDAILLWCPIAVAGLTTQLEQVIKILKKEKIKYIISYHVTPSIEHPERENWVHPKDIDSPKAVLYFEQFVPFDRGFEGAFKIFYVNLDWLSQPLIHLGRTYADLIIAPVPYKLDFLKAEFRNQEVMYLPWPSIFKRSESRKVKAIGEDEKIRVLYIGNDYDEKSRKSPFAVVQAILECNRDDLVVDLKFRSAIPAEVKQKLESCHIVGRVIDESTDRDLIETLHKEAHISLIPNECEGNGLSILEAWAFGIIPAVLNGHPMKDIVDDDCGYLIDCEHVGWREEAPHYRTSAASILQFLNNLERRGLRAKFEVSLQKMDELDKREARLEEVLVAALRTAGIRNKGYRIALQEGHKPDASGKALKISGIVFPKKPAPRVLRPTKVVDVVLTTSKRPWCLEKSFPKLISAMEASPYHHRLTVAVDGLDSETLRILNLYGGCINEVLWNRERLGLPFAWNTARAIVDNRSVRSEKRADYICYIQDDCLISNAETYFRTMVEVADAADPAVLGFVSGYYTEVHPGFGEDQVNGVRIIYSDTIDGKNFMGRPRTMAAIGPLTWWFSDGMRRGNPGPKRGSHFDLWQWKESPNALMVQLRASIIIPGITSHIADDASSSTWNNDTSAARVKERVDSGKIYLTRSG